MKRSELKKKLELTFKEYYKLPTNTYKITNLKGINVELFLQHIQSIVQDIKVLRIAYDKNEGGVSNSFPTIFYKLNNIEDKICLAGKGVSVTTGTNAAFKESMVCYFYNSTLDHEAFLKSSINIKKHIEIIINDIRLNHIEGIYEADEAYLLTVLNEYLLLNENMLSERIKNIYNPLSIGVFLNKSIFKKNGWRIDKGDLFKRIKKEGALKYKVKADKYNPMDIMLYNPKLIINKLNTNNISYVCDIFDDKIDEYDILALSLKDEKSQNGKAKGYLDIIKNKYVQGEYNFNKEELINIDANYDEYLYSLRKEAKDLVRDSNYYITYEGAHKNTDKLFCVDKCKSYKLLNYILNAENKSDYSEMCELIKFGLSMCINPNFFKLKGSENGYFYKEKIEFFKEGCNDLKIIDKIKIIDSLDKNKGIKIETRVLFNGVLMNARLLIRCNGNNHAAIEIQYFEKEK